MTLKTDHQIQNQHPPCRTPVRLELFILLLGLLGVAGCNSFGLTNGVTPQVTGRVLAADTHQPIAGVKVIRILPGQPAVGSSPANGAQRLRQGRPETTGADGNFTLSGQEYITFFRHASWWSVKLAFQAPGYTLLQTNFSAADVTNTSDTGAPAVNTGDIFLKPGLKQPGPAKNN